MQPEEITSSDSTQEMPDVRAILASIKSIDKQISELSEQRDTIDARIAELSKQRGEGVEEMARAREQIDRFLNDVRGVEQQDTGTAVDASPVATPPATTAPAPATNKVAPKYRDPITGQTWSGRGKPPLWIAGKDREQFLITATGEQPTAPGAIDGNKDQPADAPAQEEAPKDAPLPLASAPADVSSQEPSDTREPDFAPPPPAEEFPDEEPPRDLLGEWDNGYGTEDEDIPV